MKAESLRTQGTTRRHADSSSSGYSKDDNDDRIWDEGESETTDDERDVKRGGEKGAKSYRTIVSPPSPKGNVTSPTATSQPKPILKNKNENRVHFDRNGPREIAPDDPGMPPRKS